MLDFIRRWFGNDVANKVGPPTGKTGNHRTEDDFSHLRSALAEQGGLEFAEFCKSKGTCELDGEILEGFKAVLSKYPIADDEEYDYFAVVVRDQLIAQALLPAGDPERYQYKVAQWAPLMAGQT